MTQCIYIKKDGHQCSRNFRLESLYCWQHQKYENQIEIDQKHKIKSPIVTSQLPPPPPRVTGLPLECRIIKKQLYKGGPHNIELTWKFKTHYKSNLSKYVDNLLESSNDKNDPFVSTKNNLVYINIDIYPFVGIRVNYFLSLLGTKQEALEHATNEEKEWLRGLPYCSFCHMLTIANKKRKLPRIIYLSAEPLLGQQIHKDPTKLIDYYHKMGFVEEFSGDYDKFIANKETVLAMKAKTNDVLSHYQKLACKNQLLSKADFKIEDCLDQNDQTNQ